MKINDLLLTEKSVYCRASLLRTYTIGDLLGYDLQRESLNILIDCEINLFDIDVLDFINKVYRGNINFKLNVYNE